MGLSLAELHSYRVAQGLTADSSILDAWVEARLKKEVEVVSPRSMQPPSLHCRRRMVDMYEIGALPASVKITGPFRISAQIPATPAVIVAVPKAMSRIFRGTPASVSRSKAAYAQRSRMCVSLPSHRSNVNESFSASPPYRHRTRLSPEPISSNWRVWCWAMDTPPYDEQARFGGGGERTSVQAQEGRQVSHRVGGFVCAGLGAWLGRGLCGRSRLEAASATSVAAFSLR